VRTPPPRLAAALASLALAFPALAQVAPPENVPGAVRPDSILLTIFLRHDQAKTLPEINAQLDRAGFYPRFPPAGVEVVSWYVVMGVGQIVTLRVPPAKLREVNVAIENGAWGAFRTEFYPTYDFRPVWEEMRKKAPPKVPPPATPPSAPGAPPPARAP
jgi:hypothetical protein